MGSNSRNSNGICDFWRLSSEISRLSGFVVGWFWAQMAVWGAVGRTHGGPKPQLGLWGVPVATEMPPWAVVGLNGAHFA